MSVDVKDLIPKVDYEGLCLTDDEVFQFIAAIILSNKFHDNMIKLNDFRNDINRLLDEVSTTVHNKEFNRQTEIIKKRYGDSGYVHYISLPEVPVAYDIIECHDNEVDALDENYNEVITWINRYYDIKRDELQDELMCEDDEDNEDDEDTC